MSRKVIIIGAGLAGLSTGIYLQRHGIESEIFELAPWAGGVCGAWTRQGYRFDGCISWMVGTKPGTAFNRCYREVHALEPDTPIYNSPSVQMERGGVIQEIPMDIGEFRAFLRNLSPEDGAEIDAFCRDIEVMMRTDMPAGNPEGLIELLRFFVRGRGMITLARRYLDLSVADYSSRFHSQALRDIIKALMPAEISAMGLFMMLGTRMAGNAGYPLGGASGVVSRMVETYRAAGGTIHFSSRVDEILVENGTATGIRVGDALHPASAVVAACDAYDTLKRMLKGAYAHPQLDEMLDSTPLFQPLALVCFGLTRRFDIPYEIQYELPGGLEVPGGTIHGLSLRSFDFDPAAAPEGGSSVMAMIAAPLDYWSDLRNSDMAAYREQKARLAEAVAKVAETRFPGFKAAIAVTDVSTPATFVRLANLYRGSWEGFLPVPAAVKTRISPTVPGVEGLVLCGQWTAAGGGIPTAISSGKSAARAVSKLLSSRPK